MPTLGAPLDFAKLEGRNFVGHLLGTAPSSPVKGQLYMNTADNTLYWYDGTTWIAAKDTGAVGGTAGGDLSGTYPNPQIAAGVIVDADVAAANKDGAVATPSLRTLGAGAQQAMPGNRTLDAITAPAADLNLNSKKITSLANPVAATDGANKQYVDNLSQGLDAKQSVRAASNGNTALTGGPTSLDGVALGGGERVLLKNQTVPAENGIYTQDGAGTYTRATDMDAWTEVPGAYVWVEAGATNADTGWVCTSDIGGTIGSTAITWVKFSGAGQITAGAGLTKTGDTLDVGAGTGISVAADTIAVDSAIIPRYYSSATHGAGTTWTITQATHGCRASRGLVVQCQVESTGAVVIPDVSVAANGDVTITFSASQSANTIRTTIVG